MQMSKQQDQLFFMIKGDAIFTKLDALFSFVVFLGMLLDHYYGECLCVGKLSPVITFIVFYYYNRAEAKDHPFFIACNMHP